MYGILDHIRNNKYTFVLLLAIFCFSLFLRLHQLGVMPSGLHRDEVISGYVGRFILENGRDFYGNAWPLLYVDKYKDYPPALPMYLSGISTYVFGTTTFAIRFPIALIGALTIIPIYLLSWEVFKKRSNALLSALLLSILPWHVVFSRTTAEGIVALFAACLGLWHVIRFLRTKQTRPLFIASILLLLTYLLYPSYRIIVPLLFLPLPFFLKKSRSLIVLILGLFVGFSLVTYSISQTEWGRGRFDQTSIFMEKNLKSIHARIDILAQEEGVNQVRTVKIFHNKYLLLGRQFIEQYSSYFSNTFLIFNGGLPYRYAVPDQGVLLISTGLLALIGLLFIYHAKNNYLYYLLYILLITPLPSTLTIDDIPNTHRTLLMCIPLVILASFATIELLKRLSRKRFQFLTFTFLSFIFCFEVMTFLHSYWKHSNAIKSSERGDANQEMIQKVIAIQDNYQKIYLPMDDALPIYYLFFSNNFDSNLIGKVKPFLQVENLDKVVFSENCPADRLTELNPSEAFLAINRDCVFKYNHKPISVFDRHDGTTAYELTTNE